MRFARLNWLASRAVKLSVGAQIATILQLFGSEGDDFRWRRYEEWREREG